MFKHRLATSEDISDIQVLMDLSIKKLLGKILNENQLEASYESMGLDNQLIKDRTYFLIFKNNLLVGSGGYSYRRTLFGGNHTPNRSDEMLLPGKDAAKIRAMYTHTEWIRQGIGSFVLRLAEDASKEMGFDRCELMATLSGILLYEKKGYKVEEEIDYKSKAGNSVPMYKMIKSLV